MSKYLFEVSDMVGFGAGAGIEWWSEVPGLLEFKLTRSAFAAPGACDAVLAARNLTDVEQPLHPHQRFRIRDTEMPGTQQMVFVGRADEVKPQESATQGRVWRVRGRDYLACLADNHIDRGKVRNDDVSNQARGWAPGDNYVPNYEGDYCGAGCGPTGCGEFRRIIIKDLAENIVTCPADDQNMCGIVRVLLHEGEGLAPNSKPIEVNFMNALDLTVLDAIRNMCREDPWSTTSGWPLGIVDAWDIVSANGGEGDPGGGIGGEFQIRYEIAEDGFGSYPLYLGRVAHYFRRGAWAWDTNMVLHYGAAGKDEYGRQCIPITSYEFPQTGYDIFSRSRSAGRGEAGFAPPTADSEEPTGSGWVLRDMEMVWDPAKGLYAVRREVVDYDETGIGDWLAGSYSEEQLQGMARPLRDRAIANIVSGNTALSRWRGPTRGTIVVPYLLRNLSDRYMLPSQVVNVNIPHLGFTYGEKEQFIVEAWTYIWPENRMTIEVARRAAATLTEQLKVARRQIDGAVQGLTDRVVLPWTHTTGNGVITIEHKYGVKPGAVVVYAAKDSGDTDLNGNPLPEPGTVTECGGVAYEPNQGQYYGVIETKLDRDNVTIKYATWLAYSEGAGEWLRDGQCIVQIKFIP